jgi:hypothetical protein
MADLYTERLGAAGRVSAALEQESRHDPGSGKRRPPAKPVPQNVGTGDKRRDGLPMGTDDEPTDNLGTPVHRVDRLA